MNGDEKVKTVSTNMNGRSEHRKMKTYPLGQRDQLARHHDYLQMYAMMSGWSRGWETL